MNDEVIYGEKHKIDEKDKKIIEELYKDGRATISQISKRTGIRRDSVAYRIKRLLKNNIIAFIFPAINPGKIGYNLINNVLVKTKIISREEEEEFIQKLKSNKFITYIASLSGKWDLHLTICAKNPEHFNKIMKEIRAINPDYISDFEISTIVREPKYEDMIGLLG